MKKIAFNNAKKTICLIDSSKFNKRSLSTLLEITQIDILITDDQAPTDFIKLLEQQDVIINIVSV